MFQITLVTHRAMTRYRLTLEYDGSAFVGWQRQDNGLGVQAALETAVEGFCGEQVIVEGAGRTDSGVHALGQVAHLEIERDADAETVRDALNAHLRPLPVTVLDVVEVDEDFHARFSARERVYLYRILNRRPAPALDGARVWWVARPLDLAAMAAAANVLLGHHDFTTFRASECQAASPEKTLDELSLARCGDEIHFTVRARSFLHHQVRNMVGALQWVGHGKWSTNDLANALAARDRRAGGPTAPAQGLYLKAVHY